MRYTESGTTSPSQLDFVPRERRSEIWRTIGAFIIAILLIFILSFAPDNAIGKAVAGIVSLVVICVLCFYVVFRKQQNLDLVMTTEYQNLLFSQAATLGADFCMFVRRDGTVVYSSEGVREIFPNTHYSESQALETIFEEGSVNKTDRERVMGAIHSNSSDRIVFPLTLRDSARQEYILTIEPLPRPAGFSVIRGRKYRDTRAGTQIMPDVLRSTSADKLDMLLTNTPVAHFTTDSYGRFEYVNPALESLLGYDPGEVRESKLAVHHLLYQMKGEPVAETYQLADFHGDALFQRKQGSLLATTLHIHTIRDGEGKLQGATGTVQPEKK